MTWEEYIEFLKSIATTKKVFDFIKDIEGEKKNV